jgi:hypothetical protein
MSKLTRTLAALFALATLAACAGAAKNPHDTDAAVDILVFGDSGYHHNWLDEDDHARPLDARSFIIAELDDWIEDRRPITDFRLSPFELAEQTGGYLPASGLWPVASAMQSWCGQPGRCDFAVMLGDNIYPSGATAGVDGRDDAQRFEELLYRPYIGLQQQNPSLRIYPVLGNHDWDTSREGAMAQLQWLQASSLYDMPGLFYRLRPVPGVEIFAIDTTVFLAGHSVYEVELAADGSVLPGRELDQPSPWELPRGAEQQMAQWLEQAMRESDAQWKVVLAHHPIWSSSGGKYHQARVMREQLLPTLCRYADLLLVGHEHTLEIQADDCRTVLGAPDAMPLVQLVSGAAGKQRPLHRSFMAYQDRSYPQKHTHYANGQVWGFATVRLQGDKGEITVFTTPDSGSGEPVQDFSFPFARRSGR